MGKKFTKQQDDFLIKNLNVLTIKELAKGFNKSIGGVYNRTYSLKIWCSKKKEQLRESGFKICPNCFEMKTLSEFYKKGPCKVCTDKKNEHYHNENLNKMRSWRNEYNKLKYNELVKSNNLEKILNKKLYNARGHSKKLGRVFDITLEDTLELYRKQQGRCIYSGEVMQIKFHCDDAISIDRIDSSKGYLKDNIVLCCWKTNKLKSDGKLDNIKKWCYRFGTYDSSWDYII
jgi:hypothetical protein